MIDALFQMLVAECRSAVLRALGSGGDVLENINKDIRLDHSHHQFSAVMEKKKMILKKMEGLGLLVDEKSAIIEEKQESEYSLAGSGWSVEKSCAGGARGGGLREPAAAGTAVVIEAGAKSIE